MNTFSLLSKNTVVISLFMAIVMFGGACMADCDSSAVQSTPTAQFTNHRDGTVTDNATGLMWMLCLIGQEGASCEGGDGKGTPQTFTWSQAISAADEFAYGFAGYYDWRLPNTKELLSLVETSCFAPALNVQVFPVVSAAVLWSSTPVVSQKLSELSAWAVNFSVDNNVLLRQGPVSSALPIRMVRGGADYNSY